MGIYYAQQGTLVEPELGPAQPQLVSLISRSFIPDCPPQSAKGIKHKMKTNYTVLYLSLHPGNGYPFWSLEMEW